MTRRHLGAASPLILALTVACGGGAGGVCATCPPETVTLTIVNKQVTPAIPLDGDTLRIAGGVRTSDGSDATLTIYYNGVVASGLNAAEGTQESAHTGYAVFVGTRTGIDPVRDSLLVIVAPLTVTGTAAASQVTVGSEVAFTVAASAGADSVAVETSDGRRFVATGNAAVFQVPALTPGTLTLTPNAWNGRRWQVGDPRVVTVSAP